MPIKPAGIFPSARTRYAFRSTDLIRLNGIEYVQHSTDDSSIVLMRCDNAAIKEIFDHAQIADFIATGALTWRPRHFDAVRMRTAKRHPDLAAFSNLTETERIDITLQERLVQGIEYKSAKGEISLSEPSLSRVLSHLWSDIVADHIVASTKGDAAIQARKSISVPCQPSPRTALRWHHNYYASGCDILALRDGRKGRSGNKSPRIADPFVIAAMAECLQGYLDERRPTMKGQYQKLVDAILGKNRELEAEGKEALKAPSRSTFERAIRRLDNFCVAASREGLQAAKARHGIVGKGRIVLRPGERVMVDNWTITAQVLTTSSEAWKKMSPRERRDHGTVRLRLCVAMDQATRVILGATVSMTASGSESVRTMSMVCSDKTALALEAGCQSSWAHRLTPETVATDGGTEFISGLFRAVVADLGAEYETGPAATPEVRATLERFFHTLEMQLMPHFSGRTFGSLGAKGNYPSEERASLTTNEIHRTIIRWIVDVYHNTPHGGLGGKTPFEAWDEMVGRYSVLPPPDAERFREIFGHYTSRRINNRGIRILGLHYASLELSQLRRRVGQRDVLVRVNPDDLSRISVREDRSGAAWITVPCSVDGFDGVDIETWQATASELRRQNTDLSKLREETIRRAMRDIIAIGESAARRVGILSLTRTPEHLERMERELYAAFDVVPSALGGILADGITDDGTPHSDFPAGSPAGDQFDEPQTKADDDMRWTVRGRGIDDVFFTE